MIRVVYGAASKFKYVTQALAKINDEGIFFFTPEMLAANVLSPDKVTMAILKMPITSFDEFSVDEEIALLVRIDELNKVIKRATRNDNLILEYDTEQQMLSVSLADRKTGVLRQFEVTSTPLAEAKFKEPKAEFTVRAQMETDDFKSIIQDAKVVGDLIVFEAKEDMLIVEVEGEEKMYRWEMREGDPLIMLVVEEESKSAYTRQSLEAATKPTGAAETVKLSFSTDFPLQLEFTLPNGEKLVMYTAPSV
ncbi:MAG: DNA polymerase sliding clamp [Desulfurococcales archaeon]|nr:DNA polymerase sliding clamp [Desulfurococcales archaeon]